MLTVCCAQARLSAAEERAARLDWSSREHAAALQRAVRLSDLCALQLAQALHLPCSMPDLAYQPEFLSASPWH